MEMPEGLLGKSGVYQIINIANGKIYVGSAVDLYRRYYIHYGSLTRNRHENPKLQRSWNKHGEDCFEFYIIEFLPKDKALLRDREQYWIDKINPFYNIVRDVRMSFSNTPRSKKHRHNHSVAMRNSPIVQSEEYRKSQAEKVKEVWTRPEYREKYNKYLELESTKKLRSEQSKKIWQKPNTKERFIETLKRNFLSGKSYSNKKSKRAIDANLVREIRMLHNTGNYTNQDLADKFSIGHSTISRIINRKSWAFVD